MITFILLCFFYYNIRAEERERKRRRIENELSAKKRLLNLDRELSRLSANKSNIVTIARITIEDENIW
jgi:ABC-type transport system involved in cytochrome c biogenesis ATPase subunit